MSPPSLRDIYDDNELLDVLGSRGTPPQGDDLAGMLAAWTDEIDGTTVAVPGRYARARRGGARVAAVSVLAVAALSASGVAAAVSGTSIPVFQQLGTITRHLGFGSSVDPTVTPLAPTDAAQTQRPGGWSPAGIAPVESTSTAPVEDPTSPTALPRTTAASSSLMHRRPPAAARHRPRHAPRVPWAPAAPPSSTAPTTGPGSPSSTAPTTDPSSPTTGGTPTTTPPKTSPAPTGTPPRPAPTRPGPTSSGPSSGGPTATSAPTMSPASSTGTTPSGSVRRALQQVPPTRLGAASSTPPGTAPGLVTTPPGLDVAPGVAASAHAQRRSLPGETGHGLRVDPGRASSGAPVTGSGENPGPPVLGPGEKAGSPSAPTATPPPPVSTPSPVTGGS